MKKYLLVILALNLLVSCEKVIDIDLNRSNSKYVIEGNISNKINESMVKISKTLNFDDTIPYPTISGAFVTITDITLNKIDTLNESSAGIYLKPGLVGIEGHSYFLKVILGDEIIEAASTMPISVNLDSIVQETLAGSNTGGGSGGMGNPGSDHSGTSIQITPHFTDPSSSENFYQFVITINETLANDIFIRNDIGFNGNSSPLPLRVDANKGDIVEIDLQCIDKLVYNYFFGLNENINQSSATPANPKSNLNNGALGFFKAYTSQVKTISIQ